MDLYYVYQHTRLDENLVFYVGKGKKRTLEQKLKISEATKLAYQKRMGLNNG